MRAFFDLKREAQYQKVNKGECNLKKTKEEKNSLVELLLSWFYLLI